MLHWLRPTIVRVDPVRVDPTTVLAVETVPTVVVAPMVVGSDSSGISCRHSISRIMRSNLQSQLIRWLRHRQARLASRVPLLAKVTPKAVVGKRY